MTCPKCKANIGIYRLDFEVESGHASGINCYICGYWKQEHRQQGKRLACGRERMQGLTPAT